MEVIRPRPLLSRPQQTINLIAAEEIAGQQIDIGRLLKRYTWLVLCCALLGAIGGFISVILSTPMYRSRLLLDVQPPRSLQQDSSKQSDTLQTQMLMIRSGGFLRRVAERIQSETLPVAPIRNDFFTKLRTKVRPEMRNSGQLMSDGVQSAAESLAVRPVNGTTLLEISCESIHPEIAASFVNTVGSEFIDQNLQGRALDAQRMSQWLAAQVEETKSKLREAEDKLQEYVRNSNNLFAAQETTLADTSVRSYQAELAAAQSDRIGKQSQFEAVLRATPEEALNLLNGEAFQSMRNKLNDLKQQRLLLTARFTAQHPKVQQLDLQIEATQQQVRKETEIAMEKMRSELESSKRREKLLAGAYAGAASQVTAQAGQAAQYSALRREVDILRQTYSQILMQASQTSISNALPQNNMRVVDAATAATEPLRPKPLLNLAFGVMAGIGFSAGIIFLRERMDRSMKRPGSARELLSIRELGVIPSIGTSGAPRPAGLRVRITLKSRALLRKTFQSKNPLESPELIGWQQKSFLAESFRHVVASLMRDQSANRPPQVVLVTSPNSAEGKTMVCANLGISLAETGRRVLIIDADFRRPRMHSLFNLENGNSGFGDLLAKICEGREVDLSATIQETPFQGLSVLVSGPEQADLPKLLHSSELTQLLTQLRNTYDMILIDAPPVLQIVDARIMNRLSDGVVLILRSGVTDRRNALEAYRYLHEDGAHIYGAILNDWQSSRKKVDDYYNYVRKAENPLRHSGERSQDS
jgi:capsular exopolysaccharide synthesis family protein